MTNHEIHSFLNTCSDEELLRAIKIASNIRGFRESKRQMDLWFNIVKAVKEYTEQVGPITLECNDLDKNLYISSFDNTYIPGLLEIYVNEEEDY